MILEPRDARLATYSGVKMKRSNSSSSITTPAYHLGRRLTAEIHYESFKVALNASVYHWDIASYTTHNEKHYKLALQFVEIQQLPLTRRDIRDHSSCDTCLMTGWLRCQSLTNYSAFNDRGHRCAPACPPSLDIDFCLWQTKWSNTYEPDLCWCIGKPHRHARTRHSVAVSSSCHLLMKTACVVAVKFRRAASEPAEMLASRRRFVVGSVHYSVL